MASATARVTFRIVLAIFAVLFIFYVGRPLYWKLTATVHDIRHNKQTVKQGLSQIVMEAQKSVGWFHDESDSGLHDDDHHRSGNKIATNRRILRRVFKKKDWYISDLI